MQILFRDVLKGLVSGVFFLYPLWSKDALIKGCLVQVTVLITEEQNDDFFFSHSHVLKYIFKSPKHEKVTLIISDEKALWFSFLASGEGHRGWASRQAG